MEGTDDNIDQDPETTCPMCFAEFLDPEDLKLHVEQVHTDVLEADQIHSHLKEIEQPRGDYDQATRSLINCDFCESSFSNAEAYALHIRDNHLPFLRCCMYCARAYTNFDLLKKHESKHVISRNSQCFKCSQCPIKFNSLFDLGQHEGNEHKNCDGGVILNELYSILSSMLNIKAPTVLQSLGTSTAYVCSICDMTTPDFEEYISHLKTLNCRSITCDNCYNVYKEKRGLSKHLKSHKACQNYVLDSDRKKFCVKCEKKIHAFTFNEHFLSCRPIKCNVCHVIFDSIAELSSHQSKKHPLAITLRMCNFCHKEFVGATQLQKHIDRTHKGQFHLYKYKCVYCENMYFTHPKQLFGHLFSKHQDVQPFSCKICNKTFRVRKRFTLHIKLEHNSVGFVEFDDKYHVFFTDTKSEHPFQPKSFFTDDTDKKSANDDDETDAPTDVPTDVPTDAEEVKDNTYKGKKPVKLRFKQEKSNKNVNTGNVFSDFMSVSEADVNQTETYTKGQERLKRKRKSKMDLKSSKSVKLATTEVDTETDDEPLLVVKKREKLKRAFKQRTFKQASKKKGIIKNNKKKFTCNICKKYCYTFQNYHHHVSMHFKDETKKCIKCSKEFKSKTELNKHISTAHASSKLTETLKNLLERRKSGGKAPQVQISTAERFQRTIRKVKTENINSVATVTEVSDKQSAKNFIESFTPEENTKKNVNIQIESVVTVKPLSYTIMRPPKIKLTKFNPRPLSNSRKLSMPVRFKQGFQEPCKVNIKFVQKPTVMFDYEQENEEAFADYDDASEERNTVPEMAQEVMLEETVETVPENKTPAIPHKIVIPKMPNTKDYKKIRIAHLLPEAPYYNIVKLEDVLKTSEPEKKESEESVCLPSGTKLVNVNPLAHLLGDTPVEKIVGPAYTKKQYKSKTADFEKAIAKAMLKLDKPQKKKTKKSVAVEQ